MPGPAAPHPGTASTRLRPSLNGSTPRLPPQPAPAAPPRQPGPTRISRIRTALITGPVRTRITHLRRIMRRTPRHP
jgi:hypothetical protein